MGADNICIVPIMLYYDFMVSMAFIQRQFSHGWRILCIILTFLFLSFLENVYASNINLMINFSFV